MCEQQTLEQSDEGVWFLLWLSAFCGCEGEKRRVTENRMEQSKKTLDQKESGHL